MYFRNLPRSINSHRKTHNGSLFVLIRYEFFNDIVVQNNYWLDWLAVMEEKNYSSNRNDRLFFRKLIEFLMTWLYIYTHIQVCTYEIDFSNLSLRFPVCTRFRPVFFSRHRIRSPFFEHVLISPSFVFYPIWKSCIIDRVKSKCLTPIEIRPTRERNRYVRGEEGRHGEDRIQGQRGRERERETSLKSHVNPMGHGSRVHRSINLDRDKSLCKRFKLSNGHLSDVASSVSLFSCLISISFLTRWFFSSARCDHYAFRPFVHLCLHQEWIVSKGTGLDHPSIE